MGGWTRELGVCDRRLPRPCLSAGTLVELEAELERLLALGASLAWEEAFAPHVAASYRNVILRDPEGNEFCLGGGDPQD